MRRTAALALGRGVRLTMQSPAVSARTAARFGLHVRALSTAAAIMRATPARCSALVRKLSSSSSSSSSSVPPLPPASHVAGTDGMPTSAPTPMAKRALADRIMDYGELSKFRLSMLVLSTTMFGYALAPGEMAWTSFLGSTLGTGLCILSAASLNQLIEVERDRCMVRTACRPLQTKRLTKNEALAFGVLSAAAGTGIMYLTTPLTATLLAAGNIALYAFVYTPLKPRTPLNTNVGAIVGAIPPMIGWVTQTGSLDAGAWALGALLYCWQMPHFYSLAYNLREDYARGGFRMLSITHPERVGINVLAHAVAIMPLGALFAYLGVSDPWFALTSLMPASYLTWKAYAFYRNKNSETGRAVFFATLWFLPAYMLLMLLHNTVPVLLVLLP